MRLNCGPLPAQSAKMRPFNPAKIHGRALYSQSGETCGFEQGSNCRHTIRVDMFVDWDLKGMRTISQFIALLICYFLRSLDIEMSSRFDVCTQLPNQVQRMRYVFRYMGEQDKRISAEFRLRLDAGNARNGIEIRDV